MSRSAFADVVPPLPGFAQPVFDAQRVFRGALAALSRPGTIVDLAPLPTAPGIIAPAVFGLCLTLADIDTAVWLDPGGAGLAPTLRFHCGCRISPNSAEADFAVATDADAMPPLSELRTGSEIAPETSSTVFLQVQAIDSGRSIRLSGPGIPELKTIALGGIDDRLVDLLVANHRLFPCGIDVFLCCGARVLALPRSVAIEA